MTAELATETLHHAVSAMLEAREQDPIELERFSSRCADYMGQLYIILCGVRHAAEEARRARTIREYAA